MNNADMPAMPIGEQIDTCHLNAPCNGLTKREHFAGLAMQGLCHAADSEGTWAHDADTVAIAATNYADALLAELDKVQE
jgi:hypothetical protein